MRQLLKQTIGPIKFLAFGFLGFFFVMTIHWTLSNQGLAQPIVEFQAAHMDGAYFPKITMMMLFLPAVCAYALLLKGLDWLKAKL